MENKEENLLEELEGLKTALEAGNYKPDNTLKQGSSLRVTDHMELAKKYLSEKAKAALSKKGNSIIEQYDEDLGNDNYVRKVAIAKYYTCQTRADKVEDGVKAICETINELAEMGAIHSCLAPVSSLGLALQMFKYPSSAVFCFVHIKPEFTEIAKTMKHHTLEGGVGQELHGLDLELPTGEFFAECRLTHNLLTQSSKSVESRIFSEVQRYLKFLPEGTEFVGYRPIAIIDLSIPYELKFRNKFLPNVKRVELEWVREFCPINEDGKDKLHQFNLFLGVRYFGVRPYSQDKTVVDLYANSRLS